MSMFKSEAVIKLFIENKFHILIAKSLVFNILSHWSDEIRIISKLVLAKLVTVEPDFLKKIELKERKIIENLNLTEYNEEMWGVHFVLKAD